MPTSILDKPRWKEREIDVLRTGYKCNNGDFDKAASYAIRHIDRTHSACVAKMKSLIKEKAKKKAKQQKLQKAVTIYVTELPAHQDKWFCQFPGYMSGKVKRVFVELK